MVEQIIDWTVNEIEEISGLENCASLKNLSVSNNKLSKITGLSNLNLKQLDLVSSNTKSLFKF